MTKADVILEMSTHVQDNPEDSRKSKNKYLKYYRCFKKIK